MNTLDDWARVKRVLEGALEREGADREAYLADTCGTDAALRARVDALLAAADHAQAFLETPAPVLLESAVREDLSGCRVDCYQLVSRLGAGAMGDVYLAHDTKLDRPVALKVLSPAVTADRNRLGRFRQEARAASSLNHPHIVVVHDFGDLDGRPYIVTELIEGETLRDRLQRGPVPMPDVVEIGVQLSGALAALHARGLVHRDIKPENVMVRPDGYSKLLDFGLAKLVTLAQSGDPVDREVRTEPGIVIGTPRYMSPEQARGLELDARSDVWSLGAVLYEMATGRLPFAEHDDPLMAPDADRHVPPTAGYGHADLPSGLRRVISKALQPLRDLRYQSGSELCADLKRLQQEMASSRSGAAAAVPPRLTSRAASVGRRGLVAIAILAIVLSMVASVLWMRSRSRTVPTSVQRTVAVLPFQNVNGDGDLDYLRLALADEVATALSRTPSLAIRPLALSRRFAGAEVSLQHAGLQLRAGEVVTGHFAIQQSELRVTVEAVDVGSNRLLWRDTIAAPVADPVAVRDQLTSRIRAGLLPALGAAAAAPGPNRPQSAEAYAVYLKSLAMATDPEPNRDAIAMLQRASSIDPDHADTWASLALRYYNDGHYGGGGSEALRRSEAAARQALALDPDHVAATVLLFSLQVEAGRLQDGYDSAMRLVAQRPDSGEARFALSYVLRYGGLLEESARECEEAVSRDPTNPLFRTCAHPLMVLGRYDRALDFVRLDSGSVVARVLTRVIYQRMGRRDDALEQHRRLAPESLQGVAPASFPGWLARCLSGTAPAAQGQLSADDVRTFLTVREDPEPLYFWAGDLAYCGDTESAISLLRESIRRNYCGASAMETDPMFAAIRSSAEYPELLAAARACRTRFGEHVHARPHLP